MNQYTRKNRRTKNSEDALHLDEPLHLEESAQIGTNKSGVALNETEPNQSDDALHLDPGKPHYAAIF